MTFSGFAFATAKSSLIISSAKISISNASSCSSDNLCASLFLGFGGWNRLFRPLSQKHCSSVVSLIIRPVALLRVGSPRGEAEWAIDQWPLRAKGLIVLVSLN